MDNRYLDSNGLQKVADNVNTRLKTVTTMPVSAADGAIRLYVGETTGNYIKGHTYQYNDETYYCYIADDGGYYYHFYINEIKVGATVYACGAPEWFQKKADSISELTSDFSELGYVFSITAASPSSITISNGGGSIVANHSSEDDLSNVGWIDITVSGGTADLNFDPTSQNAQSGIAVSQALKQVVLDNTTTNWEDAPWLGNFVGYGSYIWSDGDTVYYSDNGPNYVLNKSTMVWEEITWSGPLTDIYANSVWNDGDNTYYSDDTSQYVFNRTNREWEPKTWYGLTQFSAAYIWKDGDTVYYSDGTNHYVLNRATSTWETKTWNGFTNFDGSCIWTDNVNIYYSYNSTHYVLNKLTDTWELKTWQGLSSFRGDSIWSDGADVYYSYYDTYTLNKSTSTWEITNPWGSYRPEANAIWKLDGQIYSSEGDYIQKQMIRVAK